MSSKDLATISGLSGAQYTQESAEYANRRYQYATSSYGEEHHMTPGLIIYPNSKEDISKVIKYARSQKIAIAVRTGGHQYSGASSTKAPNIQLDLKTTFRGKDDRQVLEKDGSTYVRTGVSWPLGLFNEFLGSNGLFVPHGQCTNVHLGGHVQTGGYGQLGRSFGLFGDHIVGLEIVDWEGNAKEVTKESDLELFSALLGGSPGNLGIITHITLKVHRDKDYSGSRGIKALYWYDPNTLERLLTILAAMSDDVDFPRNYDLCLSVLSSSNDLLDWCPEVDLKMQREHPELYGKDGIPFWPRVIIVFAQWVPFEKRDVPDMKWFEKIKEGCLFPLTTRVEEMPMSQLTKKWIFDNIREFDHPYTKSTLLSDSTTLIKDGWPKWCASRVDAIVKPEANRCWLSAQFQNFGGKNSMFTRNSTNGTSLSWRDSTLCATMDVFYDADHKTTAEDWHTVTVQQAVGKKGKFSKQERRVLWGSFGDFDLDKVWKLYYEDEEKYEKLKEARGKADPEGTFSPNTFAVARK
ncbi:hypothetical protein BJ878DRAFT_69493 [Calycina marina]|uniref:FAD-binding PCMH-type domain-containing protein n=1 Tax=Calycina marina TaxID=1763456 RepID=A0A9P7Z2L3_9HELO|nr:hypothetical protein BJ878DRAFT_69493 [Calycina marina]